jgi:plastocyanin
MKRIRGPIVITRKHIIRQTGVAAVVALAVACGGGGSNNNPGGPSPGGGSPGPSGATITISNGTVNPSNVTINTGQSVTFVNNDSRPHQISSDPHPNHTDCPPINGLGTVGANQTALTNALTTARSCGFHDHLDDTNPNLRGTIVVR